SFALFRWGSRFLKRLRNLGNCFVSPRFVFVLLVFTLRAIALYIKIGSWGVSHCSFNLTCSKEFFNFCFSFWFFFAFLFGWFFCCSWGELRKLVLARPD